MFNMKKIVNSKLFSVGAIVIAALMAASSEIDKQREFKEFEEMKQGYEELKNKVAALEESKN